MWNHKGWPVIPYQDKLLSDISLRVGISDFFKDRVAYSFPYLIVDMETPESLAQDFYGEPEDHWVIILANGVIDPFHDWPMDHVTHQEFIKSKYLPAPWQDQDYHHYENPPGTIVPDPGTDQLREDYGITNLDYYIAQTHHWEVDGMLVPEGTANAVAVTVSQYEEKMNDDKRHIQIVKLNHLPQMKKELTAILKGL